MLIAARLTCALAGGVCLIAAGLVDLEFLRTRLAADGSVTPGQAAALPLARLMLAGFGTGLLLLAALLRRILAAPWLTGLLGSRRRLETLIFLAPPGMLIGLAGYRLARGPGDPLYLLLVREDSLVEWLTALVYLAGVVVSWLLCSRLYALRRFALAGFYAVLGACCLFVALEEVSYGQRLLGFATPERVVTRNVQQEMTIHNLDFMQRMFFTLIPLAAGLFGMAGVVLLAVRRRIGRERARQLSFLVPPWYLASWFVPVALFAFYATFFWGRTGFIQWQDQEPLEALLAFGLVAFLLHNLARCRRGEAGTRPRPASSGSRRGWAKLS